MNLRKTLRLLGTFYRGYALPSLLLTACCWTLNWQSDLQLLGPLFWFKLATLALLFYYINSSKRPEYFYYLNLGLSKRVLWATTLTADFGLFLAGILLSYQLT